MKVEHPAKWDRSASVSYVQGINILHKCTYRTGVPVQREGGKEEIGGRKSFQTSCVRPPHILNSPQTAGTFLYWEV